MPDDLYQLDRGKTPQEKLNSPYPYPPINVFVTSPERGVLDIRWDSPDQIPENSSFEVTGVNIYRSYDSEFSNYTLLNTGGPIGSTFYRDTTQNLQVVDEDVSDRFLQQGSDSPNGSWILKTLHYPITKNNSQGVVGDSPSDVVLKIDGEIVPVQRVNGYTGEVMLMTARRWDPVLKTISNPILPTNTSTVTISYRYCTNLITNSVNQRIFYKVTSVSEDNETPFSKVKACNPFEIEKLDYIWAEAIRRNRWILEQGGEPVKAFIRKWIGPKCACWSPTHKSAEGDCITCFGTGIVGGYEGPVDILVGPQEGERTIELTESGLKMNHQYEVWTGPSPLLSQRDFIVRQNNDRYSIGPVNIASNRGTVLQQTFSLGYLPEGDIRHKVTAYNIQNKFNQTRTQNWNEPPVEGTDYPQITEDYHRESGKKDRGRTPTYGRIMR